MSRFEVNDWQRKHEERQIAEYESAIAFLQKYAKRHPDIEKVVWFFDGSGDSSNETFLAEEPAHTGDYGTSKEYPEEDDLGDVMYNLMTSSSKTNGYDWYNNEGGYGYLVVNLKENKYTLHFNQRIESTEYHEEEGSL
jgi:hypothetical protein